MPFWPALARVGISLGFASVLPTLAQAQDAEVVTLAPVTVLGESEDVHLISGSAAYLGVEEIRTQNYTNPARVLLQTPGVYVREEDGFGNFPNISLRGADPGRSAKLTIMEDGFLQAPAPYTAPAAYYSPRVGRMSGVEVLKGSSQLRYGPHNTSGVINYLSTPFVELDGSDTQSLGFTDKFYLKSSYGSYNTWKNHTYYGSATATDAGTFGMLFDFNHEHSDGYRTIRGVGGDTGYTSYDPSFKAFWEPNTELDQRFEFRFGYSNFEADETYVGLSERDIARHPFMRYPSTQFDEMQSEQYRASLTHIMRPTDDLRVETSVYWTSFARAWYKLQDVKAYGGSNTSPASAIGAGSGPVYDLITGRGAGTWRIRDNNRVYHTAGVQSRVDWDFTTGALEHSLTAGARLHYDQERRWHTDDTVYVGPAGNVAGWKYGQSGAQTNSKMWTTALSVYVEDAISVGALTIKPGIRWEHLWQEFENYNSGSTGRGELDIVAPGIGLTYELSDSSTVFAGYYRGFSTPGPTAAINYGLDPEISDGFELGYRYRQEGFRAELTGFYTKHSDLIVPDYIGASGSVDAYQAGDIEVYGLEASVHFDPLASSGGSVRLPVSLSATLTHAELASDTPSGDAESIFSGGREGNKVPYIPEFNLAGSIGVEYDKLGVYLNATYTPETFATASNTDHPFDTSGAADGRFGKTDDAFLVDFNVKYQVTDTLKVFGGISNLLGEEYIVSRIPYGPRSGAPRMFYGGIELEF